MIYGLGGLLPGAIGFILLPLYTQFLTPADYGILNLAATLSAVLVILLEFGLSGAFTRFYYDYLNNPEQQRKYYGTLWLFLTFVPLTVILLAIIYGESFFSILFKQIPFDPYIQSSLWITFFTISSALPLALFRVKEQPLIYIILTISKFLLTTCTIIIFVTYLNQGAAGSLRGQALAGLVFLIPFTVISLRNMSLTFKPKLFTPSFTYGAPLILHQLSGWALNLSDRILLERYVSLQDLGVYSLGYKIAQILDLVLNSIILAWTPFFFRTASTEPDAPQTFARLTTYFILLILFVALGISLLSDSVIQIMAQPDYYAASEVTPVVVLAFIAHGFYFMFVGPLFYTKNTGSLSIFTLIAASLNIILNIILLPRVGYMAAAWNTVVGFTLLSILVYLKARKAYHIPYEFKRLLILLGSAGFCFLVISQVDLANPLLEILVRTIGILIFPIVLLLLKFFTPRELSGMRIILDAGLRKIAPRK